MLVVVCNQLRQLFQKRKFDKIEKNDCCLLKKLFCLLCFIDWRFGWLAHFFIYYHWRWYSWFFDYSLDIALWLRLDNNTFNNVRFRSRSSLDKSLHNWRRSRTTYCVGWKCWCSRFIVWCCFIACNKIRTGRIQATSWTWSMYSALKEF